MVTEADWLRREKWTTNEGDDRLCMVCASVIKHGSPIGWVHGTICHKRCADGFEREEP